MKQLAPFTMMLCAVFLLGVADGHGQLRVSLNLSSRPDPYLSNWAQRKEIVIVSVTNTSSNAIDVKFDCKVNKDGALLANTKRESMQILSVQPGSTMYYGEDLVPLAAMKIIGNAEQTAARSGMLPAGEYELCVSLIDPITGSTLTQPVCKTFTIQSYQSPVLLLPLDGDSLRMGQRPLFRWTAVSPRPTFPVRYRLQVFEVMAGQTPITAFRVNQPIIDIQDITSTQQLWPPDYDLTSQQKRFVWTVRALDDNNNPIGEPDGYATPFVLKPTAPTVLPDIVTGVGVGKSGEVNQRSGEGGSSSQRSSGGGGGGDAARVAAVVAVVDGEMATVQKKSAYVTPPSLPCGQCSYPVTISDTTALAGDAVVGDSITIGRFKLKITALTHAPFAKVTGKGEITIPWLLARVLVTFDSLRVNAAKQVVKGEARAEVDASAPQYPQQWAINQATSWNWTKQAVAWVDDFVKQKGAIVKSVNSMNTPLKVPLGFNNISGNTVCISEFLFKKDDALMAMVATVPLAKLDDTLSLGLNEIPICPEGVGKTARMGLLADIDVRGLTASQPTFAITARAPSTSRPGCYVVFGCDNNSDTLSIDLDVAFPRDWITPRPDTDSTKQSVATLVGKAIAWKEWVIYGSLPSSTLVGTNGMGLRVDTLSYDFSDLANPPGIVFPANYSGATDATFNGFYAKQVRVSMPDGWRTFADSVGAPEFIAQSLIINKTGITGTLLGVNVIQFPNANLNRLSASVDTVKVILLNNNLTSAYMRGRLLLPITDTTPQNALAYKALFNNVAKSFDFSLTPTTPLDIKLFAGAKLTLLPSSSLSMTIAKNRKKFSMVLNGGLGFNAIDLQVGQKKVSVDLSPDFENMRASYTDSVKHTFDYSIGDWAFASKQKKIAKFPITIDKVKFAKLTPVGDELFRGKVNLDIILALDSNRIGGRGSFDMTVAVEKSNPGAAFKFKPRFIDFNVNKVAVHAKLAAVEMSGELNFYNEDPTWGNGFAASIKAKFKALQLQIDAAGRFGSKVDNTNNRFRYWYVDAKAILPPPGIVFLPGYAFYGFGATAWQRVFVDMSGAKPNAAAVAGATTTTTAAGSGATMQPNRTIGFGFKVLGVLGTSPDPSKLNADVALTGQFSNTGGMVNIGFIGDLWMKAKLLERASAPVKGTLNINYDFTTQIFDLNATMTVNKPPVTGNGNLKVHLEGKTGIWYVKLGEPTNRNTVAVNFLGTSISANAYFMFGKNITPPTGFTQRTYNGLASVGCYGMTPSSSGTTGAISGNGFAGGLDVGFDSGERMRDIVARLKAKWRFAGGFEFNASLLRYPNGSLCGGDGMNWWYVQANVAAYAIASASVYITPKKISDGCLVCCTKNHPNGCTFNIATIKFGAWAEAGFPNNSWIQGQATGSYDVLGGAFQGSFTAEFNVGNKCTPAPPVSATVAAQDVAAEQSTKLITSVTPAHNSLNVALAEPLMAIYSFEPNAAFELVEQQGGAGGNTINRTFQVKYAVTVEQLNESTWAPVTMTMTKDALGAYLFRRKSNVVINSNLANDVVLSTTGPMSANTIPVSAYKPPKTTAVKPPPSNTAAFNNTFNPVENTPPPTDNDSYAFDNSGVENFKKSTLDWENAKKYRATVVGTLWELNASNQWVIAKSKSTNQNITQTVTCVFSTPMPMVAVVKSAPKNNVK
ncbi:MAG: hypothetical protein IPF59_07930 [Ignavibacteria bacterium]|nr:hypothetical protein [Ignavibacteria bacterium]MBK7412791.1 hypothetical protein [Ignavibacteria bacterium]